jgi:hypothetical protein
VFSTYFYFVNYLACTFSRHIRISAREPDGLRESQAFFFNSTNGFDDAEVAYSYLDQAMDRLGHFIEGFGSRFDNVNRQTLDSIASYIHGLLSEARRKNIERIAEQNPALHYQNI